MTALNESFGTTQHYCSTELDEHGTVESVLLELDRVAPPDGFELWIPQSLTLRDKPVRIDIAMAR